MRKFGSRAALGGACLALILTGCTGTPPDAPTPTPTPDAAAEIDAPLRLAVAGDSNTNGFTGNLANGIDRAMAYVCYVVDDSIEYAGGWANDGATSTYLSQNVQPIDDVDVLTIMIGTNNPAQGIPFSQLDVDIAAVVDVVDPVEVVLLALPPVNADPEAPVATNRHLKALADDRGWYFHDAWDDVRGSNDKWNPDYLRDGLHTTKAGYKKFGGNVREYLTETFLAGE